MAPAVALSVLTLAAVPGCTAAPSATGPRITPVTDISAGCAGNSSEVEEAFAPPGYVYAEWIGCPGVMDTVRDYAALRLTWSRDGGRTWSAPLRVTPDRDQAPHIVESAGGQPGLAYIAWQTSGTGPGYATYLRPFSIQCGWLGPAVKVSAAYGNIRIWPGDTFGIARLPGGSISLTWGSAVGTSKTSAIYAAVVTL